jgi:hypothetical protein
MKEKEQVRWVGYLFPAPLGNIRLVLIKN